jgi:two-component system, OmpR family, response regulator
MRIAVLDDNLNIGEMLQQGLELVGYTVVVYSSSSKLLTDINAEEPKTTSAPFDLIIVDLHLSEGISGVEVIHRARTIFPDLPAILISAASSWEIEAASRAMPTVKVLRKPFKLSTILAITKEFTGNGPESPGLFKAGMNGPSSWGERGWE